MGLWKVPLPLPSNTELPPASRSTLPSLFKSSVASEAEIPSAIVANNIYGIDIDLRAVQLSALTLLPALLGVLGPRVNALRDAVERYALMEQLAGLKCGQGRQASP